MLMSAIFLISNAQLSSKRKKASSPTTTKEALRADNKLSTSNYGNKRLNEWTFLTSHNSQLNWADNSVIYPASNQNLSLNDQLKYGVRGFMFGKIDQIFIIFIS